MLKLIAIQHRLPSLDWLISEIQRADLCYSVVLESKPYSKIPFSFSSDSSFLTETMSIDDAFDLDEHNGYLLLDEGGGAHHALPEGLTRVSAGLEQTTSGLRLDWKCPMVLVCRSAAKLYFESQIIARGILRKLDSLELLAGSTVGVVGLGSMGSEIARALLSRGISTLGSELFQPPPDLADITVSLGELLARSDIVLGCTGTNILERVDLQSYSRRITFISCSSKDVEFRSVLNCLQQTSVYETAKGWIGNLHATVLNGGYPINFDRQREWEKFEEIILTRMLVLEGLVQAKQLIGGDGRAVMLNPSRQLEIVHKWLDQVPDRQNLRVPEILDENFFAKHSEGELVISTKPHGYSLHSTTPYALKRMRSHTSAYSVEICKLLITVLPNVWSPLYDWSSCFILDNLPPVTGKDVLEIGSGSGVISLFTALKGAKTITAVDVNPDAVNNTLINFRRYGIKNGKAFVSDVFSDVRGKYDIIIWNAPFHGCRPKSKLEHGCCDENYIGLKTFFREVNDHFRIGGKIVLGFSESGDVELLEYLISHNKYRIVRKLSDWRDGYNCLLYELTNFQSIHQGIDNSVV